MKNNAVLLAERGERRKSMDELVFEKELNEIFKLEENERNKKIAELQARDNKLSEKVIQKKSKKKS